MPSVSPRSTARGWSASSIRGLVVRPPDTLSPLPHASVWCPHVASHVAFRRAHRKRRSSGGPGERLGLQYEVGL